MNKSLKHPIHCTVFKPNILINSNESELKGNALRLYDEILNEYHPETPEKLNYLIPYNLIFSGISKKRRNSRTLSESIKNKWIYLDKEFVNKFFGEDYEISFTPFTTIMMRENHFEITIHKTLKKILILSQKEGFTKGDIDMLRGFKHDCSISLYWLARSKQSFEQVWEMEIEELKQKMFISGYKDWRNFKRHILDKAKEEMKGTWMEFDYEPIVKGRGGAVRKIKFIFKKGPNDEKELPVGYGMIWEKKLMNMGVHGNAIKQLRQHLVTRTISITQNGEKIHWSSEYIEVSIIGANEEWEKMDQNQKKRIQDFGDWFVSGLLNGHWLLHEEKDIEMNCKEIQTSVSN